MNKFFSKIVSIVLLTMSSSVLYTMETSSFNYGQALQASFDALKQRGDSLKIELLQASKRSSVYSKDLQQRRDTMLREMQLMYGHIATFAHNLGNSANPVEHGVAITSDLYYLRDLQNFLTPEQMPAVRTVVTYPDRLPLDSRLGGYVAELAKKVTKLKATFLYNSFAKKQDNSIFFWLDERRDEQRNHELLEKKLLGLCKEIELVWTTILMMNENGEGPYQCGEWYGTVSSLWADLAAVYGSERIVQNWKQQPKAIQLQTCFDEFKQKAEQFKAEVIKIRNNRPIEVWGGYAFSRGEGYEDPIVLTGDLKKCFICLQKKSELLWASIAYIARQSTNDPENYPIATIDSEHYTPNLTVSSNLAYLREFGSFLASERLIVA